MIKKTLLTIAFFCLFTLFSYAQMNPVSWTKSIGGNTQDEGYAVATDKQGNVYTTGYYTGTADLDPGTTVFNVTSNGSYDIFIVKLNPQGDFLWGKSIGGSVGADIGYAIKTDNRGNVFVSGYFHDIVDFNPDTGVSNLSAAYIDAFVLKLDSAGNFLWAKDITANRSYSIDVDVAYP